MMRGLSLNAIADKYGISKSTASFVRNGKTHNDVILTNSEIWFALETELRKRETKIWDAPKNNISS